MALMQTIIQYFILIVLLVAGFLLVTSISLQDWMREEVSMKIPKDMFETIKNQTRSAIPKGATVKQGADQIFGFMDTIPSDASVDMKVHFGLQQTCLMVTMDGFKNPIKLAIPELKWCVKNDLFTKPTKYGLSASTSMEYLEDEVKALQNARICMILAILCIALAVIILLVKVFKWQKESVLATVILALLSCICVVAALGVVHGKFQFKKDFDRIKYSLTSANQNYGGRRRRDDGSPGYSGRYPTEDTRGGSIELEKKARRMGLTFVMMILPGLEMNELIGSPLVMAGLGIGLLLLVIILNGVEFYLIRKHGGIEIKYQNVELA